MRSACVWALVASRHEGLMFVNGVAEFPGSGTEFGLGLLAGRAMGCAGTRRRTMSSS